MSLYNDLLQFICSRMLFGEELVQPYLCSVGCYIANEFQKESCREIFPVSGMQEDLRLHIVFVSPSGMSKSFTLKQFIDKKYGVIPFRSKTVGKITEAGLVGTIDKDGVPHSGYAGEYSNGFLAFHELDILFKTALADHSAELVNQVLQIISESHVNKRLGSGELDYDATPTFWGCIQPSRFDLSSGLSRRFLFVARNWSLEDREQLKTHRTLSRGSREVKFSMPIAFRDALTQLKDNFDVDEIKFDNDLANYIQTVGSNQNEMALLDKVAIGYYVLNWQGEKIMDIKRTVELDSLFKSITAMRDLVAVGGDASLLKNVLKRYPEGATRNDLWTQFKDYGYTDDAMATAIESCKRNGLVAEKLLRTGEGRGRPKRVYELID